MTFFFVAPFIFGMGIVPVLIGFLVVLIFAYAWNPVAGVLGELSLGHIVAWGAGGYAMVKVINAGWGLPVAMVVAVVVGAVVGLVIVGFATFARLDGLYLFVFTLVATYFAIAVVKDWQWLGANIGIGLSEIPISIDNLYFVMLAYVVILMVANAGLLMSRRGLIWLAIKDDSDRVVSLGWSRVRQRFIGYGITSAMASLGGGLFILSVAYAFPEGTISLGLAVVALLAIYVGGPGTLAGPLLGVLLLKGLSTIAELGGTDKTTAQWALLLQYSVALIVVTVLLYIERRRRSSAIASAGQPAVDEAAQEESLEEARGGSLVNLAEISARFPSRSATSERPQLSVSHLAKSFGGLRVLNDVSFSVSSGEVLGLVGPNGAGKSTICNIIAGDIRPDNGNVELSGKDAAQLSIAKRTLMGLGRTYQVPRVFPSLTLSENVVIANGEITPRQAQELLSSLGVQNPHRQGEHASLLERRMVEMARLIATKPVWVLLDEPLAGLTLDEHDLIRHTVSEMARQGSCVLIIEHLIPAILPVTDRMVVLDGGVLIADGPPKDVLKQESVVTAYLGSTKVLSLEPLVER
jgi:branched-chain amino acid transport system permease protein